MLAIFLRHLKKKHLNELKRPGKIYKTHENKIKQMSTYIHHTYTQLNPAMKLFL